MLFTKKLKTYIYTAILNIRISTQKFSIPDINRATKLHTITSQPNIASNNRRNPIFIKKPAMAEILNIKNLRQTDFVSLAILLLRHIQ